MEDLLHEGRRGSTETAAEEREPHERLDERDNEDPGIAERSQDFAGVQTEELAPLAHTPARGLGLWSGHADVFRFRAHRRALFIVA